MEERRPTRAVVQLIDVDDEKPGSGERVWALSQGGVLCQIIWTRDSEKHYVAWMPFPKVPQKVKDKLTRLYESGRSWGKHGTQVLSASQSQ